MQKRKTLLPTYLKGLSTGKYTLRQASESTGYSIRWLSKLKQEYLKNGLDILEHQNKHRIPANKTSQELKNKIIGIYAETYKDVNFKYFCECLEEYHNIKISLPTLRNIMQEAEIKSPFARHCKKSKQVVHQPRIRRENEGDLLQIDGTPFPWFYKFGDKKSYCIVGAIDDATEKITGLYMTEFECLYGYMEMLKQTCRNHGIPREIYSDRCAIFCCTPKSKKNLTVWEELEGLHDSKTQWQRILDELNIRQILAWSPQAKGRVERMWQTLQGRIPQEFFMNGIDTVEKANAFFPKLIEKFNKQFSVKPKKSDSFFLPCPAELNDILVAQISRKADHNACFSFHSYKFAILNCPRIACRKFTLCICESGIFAKVDGKYYDTKILDDIQNVRGDTMPKVVENIIYRYMFAFGKERSA